MPKISNIGKISYAKHFEGASGVNCHDFHHCIGKLSVPVVEIMLQKLLLAELVAHKKDSSARSANHITQETFGFAKLNLKKLGGPWRKHRLEH